MTTKEALIAPPPYVPGVEWDNPRLTEEMNPQAYAKLGHQGNTVEDLLNSQNPWDRVLGGLVAAGIGTSLLLIPIQEAVKVLERSPLWYKAILALTAIGLVAGGCSPGIDVIAAPPVMPVPPDTASPTKPAEVAPAAKPTEPAIATAPVQSPTATTRPTEMPTPTADVLGEQLAGAPWEQWQNAGVPVEDLQRWQAGASGLSEAERATAADFVAQWTMFNQLKKSTAIPGDVVFELRVSQLQDDDGNERLSVYAVDGVSGRLYGFRHDRRDVARKGGLVLMPEITGLQQRWSSDREWVEYIDAQGQLIMRGDAISGGVKLQNAWEKAGYTQPEIRGGVPRYFLPGLQSEFSGLERLSASQRQTLIDSFVLARTEHPLIYQLMDQNYYIITTDTDGGARGGVVIRLNQGVFRDGPVVAMEYEAHESAHAAEFRQGIYCDNQEKNSLEQEIGDGTIPEGFYDWSEEELIQNLPNLGAYHVSLWILHRHGATRREAFVADKILNPGPNGTNITTCGSDY